MEFNYIEKIENGVIIKDVKNFNLNHIFDCGQCFRWREEENGNYIGVAFGKVIEVQKIDNDVILYNTTEDEFENIWSNYFDLYRDYDSIKQILSKDELLKKAVEYGWGIRLLQQEPFEILISFIISANNRIPMIKKVISNISQRWGKPVEYKGKTYYTFPDIEEIKNCTIEELEACGTGFRGKYIKNTVDGILKNDMTINYIKNLGDDKCHQELQKFSGVGPKVADCIMLFSMNKYSAFPVDVWVKRAMQHFYLAPDVSLKKIRDFGRGQFGELSGFAQQYLFYYARENNIRI
ncbi:DNA-3-methyladenine glycosylase family protein [Clostridium brassicae]|uniref:DNA-(apurinic or apyrimidinic site) lyase n=1 Tax=Clostridium brassicae TaxID=2999072 RepID=A0ABT4D7I1_9CLOT|nr:DNA-3-methyladenine glycosylase [Clostridium brassicae]MCY6957004.1 DNA-3-methyladenine glycosylase [Clostridium brassicae]